MMIHPRAAQASWNMCYVCILANKLLLVPDCRRYQVACLDTTDLRRKQRTNSVFKDYSRDIEAVG